MSCEICVSVRSQHLLGAVWKLPVKSICIAMLNPGGPAIRARLPSELAYSAGSSPRHARIEPFELREGLLGHTCGGIRHCQCAPCAGHRRLLASSIFIVGVRSRYSRSDGEHMDGSLSHVRYGLDADECHDQYDKCRPFWKLSAHGS